MKTLTVPDTFVVGASFAAVDKMNHSDSYIATDGWKYYGVLEYGPGVIVVPTTIMSPNLQVTEFTNPNGMAKGLERRLQIELSIVDPEKETREDLRASTAYHHLTGLKKEFDNSPVQNRNPACVRLTAARDYSHCRKSDFWAHTNLRGKQLAELIVGLEEHRYLVKITKVTLR